MESHTCPDTTIGTDQESLFAHFLEVLGLFVDRGPYGNHELDTHICQFLDHSI